MFIRIKLAIYYNGEKLLKTLLLITHQNPLLFRKEEREMRFGNSLCTLHNMCLTQQPIYL